MLHMCMRPLSTSALEYWSVLSPACCMPTACPAAQWPPEREAPGSRKGTREEDGQDETGAPASGG